MYTEQVQTSICSSGHCSQETIAESPESMTRKISQISLELQPSLSPLSIHPFSWITFRPIHSETPRPQLPPSPLSPVKHSNSICLPVIKNIPFVCDSICKEALPLNSSYNPTPSSQNTTVPHPRLGPESSKTAPIVPDHSHIVHKPVFIIQDHVFTHTHHSRPLALQPTSSFFFPNQPL